MTCKSKAQVEVLDFTMDWATHLDAGETIATSAWATSDPDLVVDSDTNDTTTATVWLSAGVTGRRYRVINTITTSDLRTRSRYFELEVKDKIA